MSGALLRMETGRGIAGSHATPVENIVLGLIFLALVAATCTMGALMVLARRRQGKSVDTTPQMLPVLTVANSIMAVVGAYRYSHVFFVIDMHINVHHHIIHTCGGSSCPETSVVHRWWGFALGSLVNMTVTLLLFLSNKRFGALAGDKKSTGRTASHSRI
jgi:hypothetical protein